MNSLDIVFLTILLVPIKFIFFYTSGKFFFKIFNFSFEDEKEKIFMYLILGFLFQYCLISTSIFFKFISNLSNLIFLILIIILFFGFEKKNFRKQNLKKIFQIFCYNGNHFYLKLINLINIIFLISLTITTSLVPFIEFESFRWLRPVKLMLENNKFIYTPEEIMFWLPQTAQFHDAFNLSLGDITFVSADRILILITIYLGLKILSLKIYKFDFSHLIFCFLIANETGQYLIPYTFLKGHIYACLYGIASLILYFKFLNNDLNKSQLFLSGIILGVGSSVTFHNLLIIIVFGFHYIIKKIAKIYLLSKEKMKSLGSFILNGFIYFIPAILISSVWIIRNLYLKGDPIYPYGKYYPTSGSYGLENNFISYIIQNLQIFKFSGFAHSTHVIGPVIGLGFLLSILLVFIIKRFKSEKKLFFEICFIFSILIILTSSFISNISPRYVMNWVTYLAICSVFLIPLGHLIFKKIFLLFRRSKKEAKIIKYAFSSFLVLLVTFLYLNFNLKASYQQIVTGLIMNDFRKVSTHSQDLVNYMNDIYDKNKNFKFANPTMLGSDFYLKPFDMISYGWPPFQTALRWLKHDNPEKLFSEIKKDNVNYIIYFSSIPHWMFKMHDYDHISQRSFFKKDINKARKSKLRETLVFFKIDDQGKLKKFNSKYLKLLFKSKEKCNYWTLHGCYNNGFENQYLFKVRKKPVKNYKWIDLQQISIGEIIYK